MSRDMKAFNDLLGMGKVSDVCKPEYCSYSQINRQGDKSCKEKHPTGNKECCEWHSDTKYRCK